jgi:hypothetical protein
MNQQSGINWGAGRAIYVIWAKGPLSGLQGIPAGSQSEVREPAFLRTGESRPRSPASFGE